MHDSFQKLAKIEPVVPEFYLAPECSREAVVLVDPPTRTGIEVVEQSSLYSLMLEESLRDVLHASGVRIRTGILGLGGVRSPLPAGPARGRRS